MPARLRDLIRAVEALGVVVDAPNSGSHWKARRDGKTYPLPAHNGARTELDDVYIRGLCRCFGLDEAELRRHL